MNLVDYGMSKEKGPREVVCMLLELGTGMKEIGWGIIQCKYIGYDF